MIVVPLVAVVVVVASVAKGLMWTGAVVTISAERLVIGVVVDVWISTLAGVMGSGFTGEMFTDVWIIGAPVYSDVVVGVLAEVVLGVVFGLGVVLTDVNVNGFTILRSVTPASIERLPVEEFSC